MRRATVGCRTVGQVGRISIHALREESDWKNAVELIEDYLFQSTLSVRRATRAIEDSAPESEISIHALREESDA